MNSKVLGLLLILCLVLFVLWWIRRKFKTLTLPCVFFVSGAIKSGKTLLSVHLAIKEYKKAVRHWKIRQFLLLFFRFKKTDDDNYAPMLYSNIPLADVKYNPLTMDIILRQVRIPNKSVVLIDEVSLFADSMLFKDKELNNKLMAFYKLYGHYSHGGKMIIDSQSIADNHFSFKRCMGSYIYIYERRKYPFFSVLKVRELMYSEDNSIQNNFIEDAELSFRKILITNRTYNKYDCYCYSCFTDKLVYKVDYNAQKKSIKDNLKCYSILSLNDFVIEMNKKMEELQVNEK